MNILFKTIHGSRLYGLDHEGSDWDYYTVVDKVKNKRAKYSTHTIVDGLDSVVVDFGTWVDLCQKGVPQALEAMFSQKADIDHVADFRAAFRGGRGAEATYMRTINAMSGLEDDYKRRRHVLRLGLNANELISTGRFNPTLNPEMVKFISQMAKYLDMDACKNLAHRLAYALDGVVS